MRVSVGLENNIAGRSLAWALDFPGCFAYGADETEALLNLPRALVNYAARIHERATRPWLELGDFDVRLVETFICYRMDDNYEPVAAGQPGHEINAWFRHDWKPLTALETRRGLELLSWSRADLLDLTGGLSPQDLDREHPSERWSIRGILDHIATAEWWYLDRLGLAGAEYAAPPEDVFERLAAARARLQDALPDLAGRDLVTGARGEFWSPRKLLRRAAWHELDHLGHIARLLLDG